MGIKFRIVFFLIGMSVTAKAQYQFHVTADEVPCADVKQLNNGGYIYCSAGYPGGNYRNIQLSKAAPDGTLIWDYIYDDINAYPYAVGELPDGSYVLTGYTNAGTENNYLMLVKTDSAGNFQFATIYGSPGSYPRPGTTGNTMQVTKSGQLIIAGGHGYGGYLLKTDIGGNVVWAKVYNDTVTLQDNIRYPSDGPYFTHLEITTDGGFIITGEIPVTNDGIDILLAKTDSNGVVQWAKSYGGPSIDISTWVEQTADGGYIVTANTNSFVPVGVTNRIMAIKTDSAGSVQWVNNYGRSHDDGVGCVIQTPDNGYLIGGSSEAYVNSACLLKLDSTGDIEWVKKYGDHKAAAFTCGVKTMDAGYAFFGTALGANLYGIKTDSQYNSGCVDSFFIFSDTTFTLTTGNVSLDPVISDTTTQNINDLINPTSYGIENFTVCTSVATRADDMDINSGYKVYPNPTNGKVNVQGSQTAYETLLSIVDITGRTITPPRSLTGVGPWQFDMTGLAEGIYFIRCSVAGQTQTIKVVKDQ